MAKAPNQTSVQTILPDGENVCAHVLKGGDSGVAQNAVRGAGFGVVADEKRSVEAVKKAFELTQHARMPDLTSAL